MHQEYLLSKIYSQNLLNENNNIIFKTFNLFQIDRSKLKVNILRILEKYNFSLFDIMKMQYYDLQEYIDIINETNKKTTQEQEAQEKNMNNSFKMPNMNTNYSAIMNKFK